MSMVDVILSSLPCAFSPLTAGVLLYYQALSRSGVCRRSKGVFCSFVCFNLERL